VAGRGFNCVRSFGSFRPLMEFRSDKMIKKVEGLGLRLEGSKLISAEISGWGPYPPA
jgi:hypothetical protein